MNILCNYVSWNFQLYMVDFGKSYKMRKISGKIDKPNTDSGFNNE